MTEDTPIEPAWFRFYDFGIERDAMEYVPACVRFDFSIPIATAFSADEDAIGNSSGDDLILPNHSSLMGLTPHTSPQHLYKTLQDINTNHLGAVSRSHP